MKLVTVNTFVLRNGDSYIFHNSCGNTIRVPETQEIFTEELLPPAVNMEDTLKESRAENIGYSNANNDNFGVEIIIKELNSFRKFQAKIESKFDNLEEAINGDIEFKINKKIFASAITRVFLPTIQLKRMMTKALYKMKVIVVGDSHLNGINKKGLCENPTSKSKAALDKTDTLVGQKPDRIIVHPGTNDITKGINILNTVKKIEKKINNSLPNTRLVFSSLICQNRHLKKSI